MFIPSFALFTCSEKDHGLLSSLAFFAVVISQHRVV